VLYELQVTRRGISGPVISHTMSARDMLSAIIAGCDYYKEKRVGREKAFKRVAAQFDDGVCIWTNAEALGINQALAAFVCQPVQNVSLIVEPLSSPPGAFEPQIWDGRIGSKCSNASYSRRGDRRCLLMYKGLRRHLRVDLSDWSDADTATDPPAPSYSSVFDFARVGSACTVDRAADELCAGALSRARCVDVENITVLEKTGLCHGGGVLEFF